MAKKSVKSVVPPAPVAKTESTKVELSKVPVQISGKTFNLCFDFADLAKAESFYREQGHDFNLIFALPQFTLQSLQIVLPCALKTHHPELTWKQARELVTLQSSTAIALAVATALGALD